MYDFFYRTNTFALYMLSISSGYRYLLTLITSLLLIVCWFFCLYQPLASSLANYHQQCIIQRVDTHEKIKIEEEYATVASLIENAERRHRAKVVALKQDSLLAVTNDLFKYIKKYELIFDSYRPDTIITEEFFSYQPLIFDLQGSFTALSSFFEEIEKSKHFLVCDTVHIRKINKELLACSCVFNFIQIKKEL